MASKNPSDPIWEDGVVWFPKLLEDGSYHSYAYKVVYLLYDLKSDRYREYEAYTTIAASKLWRAVIVGNPQSVVYLGVVDYTAEDNLNVYHCDARKPLFIGWKDCDADIKRMLPVISGDVAIDVFEKMGLG